MKIMKSSSRLEDSLRIKPKQFKAPKHRNWGQSQYQNCWLKSKHNMNKKD